MQIPVQFLTRKCNAGAQPRSRCRGKGRTAPRAEARRARHVALPAAERSLGGDCTLRAGEEEGCPGQRPGPQHGALHGPRGRGCGTRPATVNWVDALRTPTLAHELIIFIRVHNILPCKAVLFSTPSAKRLIMELKLLVINPSQDTRGSLWSRDLDRAEVLCGQTVVCFDVTELRKLRNPAT